MSISLDQPDLAVGDQLGAADIEVIAAAAGAKFQRPAGAVFAEFEPKARLLQPRQQRRVELADLFGDDLVRCLDHFERHRGIQEVPDFDRRPVAEIGLVVELRARVDIDDQGRAALNHGDVGAVGLQLLADVMRAGAGPHHDDGFAAPLRAGGKLAGMQHLAGEILDRCDGGNVGRAADAGRHHDMFRAQHANAAVAAPDPRHPALRRLIVFGALEHGAGPEVDLHALDIGFEPVGDLVLGDVVRPVRRERHVAQVIDRRLVMQLEAVIAQPPVVADALLPVDDQRIEAQPLQLDRRGDPGMSAADHQNIGLAPFEGDFGLAFFEPVLFGEIAVVRGGLDIARLRRADLLDVEHRRQRPGLWWRAGRRQQPDNADGRTFAVSNRKIASITSCPATTARRGMSNSVSTSKPAAATSRARRHN